MAGPRIGVVGATGAVGTITLELLAERGYDVRAFASARSAGSRLPFGEDDILVEEATPEILSAGDVDLFLFSIGTGASRELVPIASEAGAICIDKSSAYRLVDGYPLVVPEVNANRALEALERDRIVANPNCCTIPLTCVLKPLHDVVPLKRVHVSTYQSVSGAGAQRMEQLRGERSADHNLVMETNPTRSRSSAPRHARSSSFPTSRSVPRACGCPCSWGTRRRSGSSSRTRFRHRMRRRS
jgi:aspartate-semialdehyde dehydrogenase